MSKIDSYESHLQQMIFQNVVSGSHIANIGSGLLAAATAGSFHVSLHDEDPGEAGDQTTSETAYTNYPPNGRQAVARNATEWPESGGTVDNGSDITYPTGGATGATIKFFGVGCQPTGVGQLLHRGTVTPNLVVSSGVQPKFSIGDCNIAED